MNLKQIFVPLLAVGCALAGPKGGSGQTAAPPPTGAGNREALTSWTSDRHPLREGDIITILVDEHLLASAQKDESATQLKDRDVGLNANTPGNNSGLSIRTRNDVSDRTRGEASRSQRFSGEISARILEVSPSGLARIEGTKRVQIDEVEEALTVRGWVRPQDLSLHNTVESWRLSDTEILLTSKGTLGEQKGFWSKLLNWIWP